MSIQSLPPMEHTFSIDLKGSETGKLFQGTFTYKRPNLKSRSEIAKTVARFNEDVKTLDADTKVLHEIMAALKHTLVASPDWWVKSNDGFDLYDLNVIYEVYKSCSDFNAEWLKKVWQDEEAKS